MADISKIVTPDSSEYDIKDATARSGLSDKMDKANPTGSGSFSLNRKANTTIGGNSFAEGYRTTASGYGSHAEGSGTTASSRNAHAEGTNTTASDNSAHAEGSDTVASGGLSHAEGYSTTASGYGSHTEGYNTTADGSYSHAEGYNTTAGGGVSHAEGYGAIASGPISHAEGYYTTASGTYSHADGFYSAANHKSQHVFGEYNALDNSSAAATERGNYVEIVGNGTNSSSRSNARTLDWSGNEVLSGTIEATGFGTTLDREVDRGGVQLTQAQYDALVNAGTVDANTTYFITDANNTTASYAAGVTYDNTSSGLAATNVQTAIDQSIMVFPNAGSHNSIYRGRYLGDEVTADQYVAIAAGTFNDMYIGDYWTINGVNWRIAHFDYWLHCGDTETTTHHVVVVPDTILYSAKMNETNVTTGGYMHSLMRGGVTYQDTFTGDGTTTVFTLSYSSSFVINVKIGTTTQATSTYTISGNTLTFNTAPANGAAIEANYINTDYLNQGGLVQAKTMIEAAFGSAHILSHRELLSTASNSSGASNWGWADSTIDLMSETMVYGCKVWANSGYDVGIDKEQLALFRHDVSRLTTRSSWWLRSVCSSAFFSVVDGRGNSNAYGASYSYGVRPAFALCS